MSELRQKMIEALQLKGLSERTQECYVRAVRQLAEHFRQSPDLISEDELRQYFLYLKNVKNYSRSATTHYRAVRHQVLLSTDPGSRRVSIFASSKSISVIVRRRPPASTRI